MREHTWSPDGRDVKNEKPGEWHVCSGCGKRVFFPDSFNHFQKRIAVMMAWINESPYTGSFKDQDGKDVGYHAILARDCDEATKFVVQDVHDS